jgi:hypothetical protein
MEENKQNLQRTITCSGPEAQDEEKNACHQQRERKSEDETKHKHRENKDQKEENHNISHKCSFTQSLLHSPNTTHPHTHTRTGTKHTYSSASFALKPQV